MMKDTIQYGDFIGSVHFSAGDEVFFGKIEGISDLVTYESDSVQGLISSFREAVEDYIALCKKNKREPHKSYKGSFNVRLSPELHRKAVEKAQLLGIPLNRFVQRAIEHEVEQ